MSFRKSPLLFILLPLCVLAAAASFYRFIELGDYVVEYDGMCDPVSEACFVGCVDDECTEIYYYAWVQKHANEVYAQCGSNVTDCEAASVCLPTDTFCSIRYCSPESVTEGETCEDLDQSSMEDTEQEEPEEEIDAEEINPL